MRDHRRGERDRGRVGAHVRRRGRAGGRRRPQPERGRRARDRGRRHRRGPGPGAVRARRATSSATSTCCSTTPASTPIDDTSVVEEPLEAWQRVQDVNVRSVFLCCKHGIPPPARKRRRVGDQHGLVRRRDGRRGLADLLHRVEGRRAGDVARAGGRVRPPRGARQRALPRSGQHAAAPGAVRERPGEGRAAAGPPADGPLRRAARDRPGGASSSPATSPRTSPRRPSSSTAGSRAPTSRPRPASSARRWRESARRASRPSSFQAPIRPSVCDRSSAWSMPIRTASGSVAP